MTNRNFSYVLLYINDGDGREDAMFCQEFETMTEAERIAKRCLRDGWDREKPDGRYVVGMHDNAHEETVDLFTMRYDGKDITEEMNKDLVFIR